MFRLNKTILISAGGTGGHIFPALSIAKKLLHEYNVVWVGAKSGIEATIIPKNNIPLYSVNISGLRNKGSIRKILMPFMLLRSFFECLKIIIKTKPDVIVGFGGYATFSICFVGVMLRIPVIIHEQNSIAGLTNKILSKIVTKVLVAYNGVLESKNTVVTGNPVRDEINNLDAPEIRYKDRSGGLNILVVGGSLGAKKLNEIMPEVCALLPNLDYVVHQVGCGDAGFVSQHYQKLGVNAKVHSFIEDMAIEYGRADLIICRSGASTVSEIMSAGVATVFVPYPYAVDDHQRYNVEELVKSGASFMVLQEDISTDLLVSMIKSLDREECLKMAKLSRSFAIPDSTDRIVKVIQKYII